MQTDASTIELLGSIDRKLSAVVALVAYRVMEAGDLPNPSYPSLDFLLSESGLSNSEIGQALGKTSAAARMQVSRDRKRAQS